MLFVALVVRGSLIDTASLFFVVLGLHPSARTDDPGELVQAGIRQTMTARPPACAARQLNGLLPVHLSYCNYYQLDPIVSARCVLEACLELGS